MKGPVHRALERGIVCRFEEVTRVQPEIQDVLIGLLSDKVLQVPELEGEEATVFAARGFNVLATANLRDRGVHEMSSALKRRFNFETVQPISDRRLESRLIREQTDAMLRGSGVDTPLPDDVVDLLVTAFHDLRHGVTEEGTVVERPTAVMSSAEAVAVGHAAALDAHFFGGGPAGGEPRRAAADRHGAQGQPRGRQEAAAVLRRRREAAGPAQRPVAAGRRRPPRARPLTVSAAGQLTDPPSAAEVRALAARMIRDDLVVLPVRHHSPACALQVQRAIDARRPSVVLVEGPRGFDPLVPLLTAPEAVMPLAVYAYAVWPSSDAEPETRTGGYYPFCDYSPELVGLRRAAELAIPARFVDLDLAEQHVLARDAGWGPDPDAGRSLQDERHYEHSRGLRLLADRLGCRDQEDLWEALFETGRPALEQHVAAVAAYCLLARRDHTAADLAADGTTAREAEMTWHVRRALDERRPGDGPVLVVLGGFHAVALPDLLEAPPPRPAVRTGAVSEDSVLIRYTFERLERLNGYAAGMTSPAWHQQVWDRLRAGSGDPHPRVAATLTALLDVTRELRDRHGMPVPQPAVSAAYDQAVSLARLRDREAPLRSDLLDALTSCLVKGDADVEGVHVHAAARKVLTGDRVGVLPPGAGTPPLVVDTLERLRRQRLRVDSTEPRRCDLDLYRRADHRTTSRLLHGLVLLGVPFAARTAGPDFVHGTGLGRLHERWEYAWSPLTEGALAEASILGSTLPAAVANRFADLLAAHRESGEHGSAGAAVALLTQACVLGLHAHVGETLGLVTVGIGEDPTFDGVTAAAVRLALLRDAREPLEAHRLEELPDLLRAAYHRATYLGRELRGQECPPRDAVVALTGLRELLAGAAGQDLDADLYWSMLERLRDEHDVALVRGAATGLCHADGRLPDGALAAAVTGHLGGTVDPETAVGFLCGLLLTAREAAWQRPDLLAGLDGRLGAWDEQTFLRMLPDLRLAFAALTPAETDRVAASVAGLHGLGTLGSLVRRDVDEDDVRRHLAVSQRVAEVLAGDGLGDWAGTGGDR